MSNKKVMVLLILLLLSVTSCNKEDVDISNNDDTENHVSQSTEELFANEIGEIYLYGEQHGNKVIIEKEFELWKLYYDEESMRHLFMEMPYFTAEFLNVWMSEDSDSILEAFNFDNYGAEQDLIDFFKAIKTECPETIFHGTDIGLTFLQDGIRFRNYLEENNLMDSEIYLLSEEAIEQGKHFGKTRDDVYRETKMVENFVREFNNLLDQSIMGIYGADHISFNPIKRRSQTIETMGSQLNKIYEGRVETFDLRNELLEALIDEPLSIDQIIIAGKTYQASYFGKVDINWSSSIVFVEYWRLDNAYEDFKNSELTGEIASYYEYPMVIELNQVYMMTAKLSDNTFITAYSISDGDVENDLLITKSIIIDE